MSPKSFLQFVGVPPSTATTKDSVLIIIDAQNEYATGLLTTVNVAETRKVIYNLLEKYRKAGGTVVHVLHITPGGAPVFTPDTDLAKEFAELEPLAGEKIVEKHHPSAFAATDLDEFLKKERKKKLVLTGYMSHVCVSTTARAGAERGYEVLVAEDAVGDRDIPGGTAAEVVKIVLAEIGDAFGTIVHSSEIY